GCSTPIEPAIRGPDAEILPQGEDGHGDGEGSVVEPGSDEDVRRQPELEAGTHYCRNVASCEGLLQGDRPRPGRGAATRRRAPGAVERVQGRSLRGGA